MPDAAGDQMDFGLLQCRLAGTVIACAGASHIATSADTVLTILSFALGPAGVAAPVVLGLVAGFHDDRGNPT